MRQKTIEQIQYDHMRKLVGRDVCIGYTRTDQNFKQSKP